MSAINSSELVEFQCQWCKSIWADVEYTSRRRYCSWTCEEQERVVFSLARHKKYPYMAGDMGYPDFDDEFE